jgi:hypothetical protein
LVSPLVYRIKDKKEFFKMGYFIRLKAPNRAKGRNPGQEAISC